MRKESVKDGGVNERMEEGPRNPGADEDRHAAGVVMVSGNHDTRGKREPHHEDDGGNQGDR